MLNIGDLRKYISSSMLNTRIVCVFQVYFKYLYRIRISNIFATQMHFKYISTYIEIQMHFKYISNYYTEYEFQLHGGYTSCPVLKEKKGKKDVYT